MTAQLFVSTCNFLTYGGFLLPPDKDDMCVFVWNAEEVTEILGIKRIKVKENVNLWLMSTA